MDMQIVNSCRVCGADNQDECEKLINDNDQLTPAGELYEDTLDLRIDSDTVDCYPQYICHSCELQLKLLKRLKDTARNTLARLERKFAKTKHQQNQDILFDNECMPIKEELSSFKKDGHLENEGDIDVEEHLTEVLEEFDTNKGANYENKFIEFLCDEIQEDENRRVFTAITPAVIPDKSKEAFEEGEFTSKSSEELRYDNIIIDENKYAEIVDADEQAYQQETPYLAIPNTDEVLDDTHSGLFYEDNLEEIYLDVDYLEEAKPSNPAHKKPTTINCCESCALVFDRRSQLTQHRRTVHGNKYECPECSKSFLKADSLRVHMKLHRGEPAYQCTICAKTFHQKVHYKYHLDRHNNVRKFNCECGKAFLSKSDLNIHQRTHTNDRRYRCDECGKFFLLAQHLKMHKFSHVGKTIVCSICQQKFTSPSTLHMHMKTIHSDDSLFSCDKCDRKFRRKHHMLIHQRLHQKNSIGSTNDLSDVVGDENCNGFMEMIQHNNEDYREYEISELSNEYCVVEPDIA